MTNWGGSGYRREDTNYLVVLGRKRNWDWTMSQQKLRRQQRQQQKALAPTWLLMGMAGDIFGLCRWDGGAPLNLSFVGDPEGERLGRPFFWEPSGESAAVPCPRPKRRDSVTERLCWCGVERRKKPGTHSGTEREFGGSGHGRQGRAAPALNAFGNARGLEQWPTGTSGHIGQSPHSQLPGKRGRSTHGRTLQGQSCVHDR